MKKRFQNLSYWFQRAAGASPLMTHQIPKRLEARSNGKNLPSRVMLSKIEPRHNSTVAWDLFVIAISPSSTRELKLRKRRVAKLELQACKQSHYSDCAKRNGTSGAAPLTSPGFDSFEQPIRVWVKNSSLLKSIFSPTVTKKGFTDFCEALTQKVDNNTILGYPGTST